MTLPFFPRLKDETHRTIRVIRESVKARRRPVLAVNPLSHRREKVPSFWLVERRKGVVGVQLGIAMEKSNSPVR
jgi:hypothetical protein